MNKDNNEIPMGDGIFPLQYPDSVVDVKHYKKCKVCKQNLTCSINKVCYTCSKK